MPAWNRSAVESELLDRLWNYFTGHAVYVEAALVLDGLLCLTAGSTQRLVASRLLNPALVDPVLCAIESHMHVLKSSTAREAQEHAGRLVGRVDWQTTYVRRLVTANPLLVRSAVVDRAYDNWETRTLLYALRAIENLVDTADMGGRGALAVRFHGYRERCGRLSLHSKLRQARRVESIPAHRLERLSSRPGLEPVARFVADYQSAIRSADPSVVLDLLGRSVLAPVEDETLYELLVGFRLLDALEHLGYVEIPMSLRGLAGDPFALLVHPTQGEIRILRETGVFELPAYRDEPSHFREVLRSAGMRRSSLRPDFLLEFDGRPCLVVEVKHTSRDSKTRDRDGIRDALAYLKDAEAVFAGFGGVSAMVVAYASEAVPATGTPIVVCDENRIGDAMRIALA